MWWHMAQVDRTLRNPNVGWGKFWEFWYSWLILVNKSVILEEKESLRAFLVSSERVELPGGFLEL